MLPEVGARHTQRLVRHVHHGDEHVHQEDDGDDRVEYEQEASVHRVAGLAYRLLRVQVRHDIHHVVEDLQYMMYKDMLYGAKTWATTRGKEARLEVNESRMLRWMCGVTRRDKVCNEHIRGTTRVVQSSNKITEKRLKWYGHERRMKEEHIGRRMLDVDIPGKRRIGRPHLQWKDACKRDTTEVGLKEDNTTNRAAWRNKIISYTGDPR